MAVGTEDTAATVVWAATDVGSEDTVVDTAAAATADTVDGECCVHCFAHVSHTDQLLLICSLAQILRLSWCHASDGAPCAAHAAALPSLPVLIFLLFFNTLLKNSPATFFVSHGNTNHDLLLPQPESQRKKTSSLSLSALSLSSRYKRQTHRHLQRHHTQTARQKTQRTPPHTHKNTP